MLAGAKLLDRDKTLVKNTLNGDIDSFSLLIGSYQEPLFNFLFRLTSCREDAEEVLQDVFIRVYNYLYKYDERWNFSTWIYKIAVNTFKGHYKKKKKHCNNSSFDILSESIFDSNDTPDKIFETKEKYMDVVHIINNLKGEQKAALFLKYVHGFSYMEIGKVLKISAENAKLKVFRAKQTVGKEFNSMNGGVAE